MAAKIKDGLFIGDTETSQSEVFINDNKISNLINLAGREVPNVWAAHGLVYLTYYWEDRPEFKLFSSQEDSMLQDIVEFIDVSITHGISVLLFSRRGTGRCVVAACLYLMMKYRWGFEKTYDYVYSKKPDIELNKGFIQQMFALDMKLLAARQKAHALRRGLENSFKIEANMTIKDIAAMLPQRESKRWNAWDAGYLEPGGDSDRDGDEDLDDLTDPAFDAVGSADAKSTASSRLRRSTSADASGGKSTAAAAGSMVLRKDDIEEERVLINSFVNSKNTITSLPGPYRSALDIPKLFKIRFNSICQEEDIHMFPSSPPNGRNPAVLNGVKGVLKVAEKGSILHLKSRSMSRSNDAAGGEGRPSMRRHTSRAEEKLPQQHPTGAGSGGRIGNSSTRRRDNEPGSKYGTDSDFEGESDNDNNSSNNNNYRDSKIGARSHDFDDVPDASTDLAFGASGSRAIDDRDFVVEDIDSVATTAAAGGLGVSKTVASSSSKSSLGQQRSNNNATNTSNAINNGSKKNDLYGFVGMSSASGNGSGSGSHSFSADHGMDSDVSGVAAAGSSRAGGGSQGSGGGRGRERDTVRATRSKVNGEIDTGSSRSSGSVPLTAEERLRNLMANMHDQNYYKEREKEKEKEINSERNRERAALFESSNKSSAALREGRDRAVGGSYLNSLDQNDFEDEDVSSSRRRNDSNNSNNISKNNSAQRVAAAGTPSLYDLANMNINSASASSTGSSSNGGRSVRTGGSVGGFEGRGSVEGSVRSVRRSSADMGDSNDRYYNNNNNNNNNNNSSSTGRKGASRGASGYPLPPPDDEDPDGPADLNDVDDLSEIAELLRVQEQALLARDTELQQQQNGPSRRATQNEALRAFQMGRQGHHHQQQRGVQSAGAVRARHDVITGSRPLSATSAARQQAWGTAASGATAAENGGAVPPPQSSSARFTSPSRRNTPAGGAGGVGGAIPQRELSSSMSVASLHSIGSNSNNNSGASSSSSGRAAATNMSAGVGTGSASASRAYRHGSPMPNMRPADRRAGGGGGSSGSSNSSTAGRGLLSGSARLSATSAAAAAAGNSGVSAGTAGSAGGGGSIASISSLGSAHHPGGGPSTGVNSRGLPNGGNPSRSYTMQPRYASPIGARRSGGGGGGGPSSNSSVGSRGSDLGSLGGSLGGGRGVASDATPSRTRRSVNSSPLRASQQSQGQGQGQQGWASRAAAQPSSSSSSSQQQQAGGGGVRSQRFSTPTPRSEQHHEYDYEYEGAGTGAGRNRSNSSGTGLSSSTPVRGLRTGTPTRSSWRF